MKRLHGEMGQDRCEKATRRNGPGSGWNGLVQTRDRVKRVTVGMKG